MLRKWRRTSELVAGFKVSIISTLNMRGVLLVVPVIPDI
jgi:hypothetical protein